MAFVVSDEGIALPAECDVSTFIASEELDISMPSQMHQRRGFAVGRSNLDNDEYQHLFTSSTWMAALTSQEVFSSI